MMDREKEGEEEDAEEKESRRRVSPGKHFKRQFIYFGEVNQLLLTNVPLGFYSSVCLSVASDLPCCVHAWAGYHDTSS